MNPAALIVITSSFIVVDHTAKWQLSSMRTVKSSTPVVCCCVCMSAILSSTISMLVPLKYSGLVPTTYGVRSM